MPHLSNDDISKHFDQALATGDDDAERVGWHSQTGQFLRFEALLEGLAPGDLGPNVRLLDIGCGMGDLYGYLRQTGRQVQYTGVDLSPDMIEAAKKRYPDAHFEVGAAETLPGEWEVVVCSGTFGVGFGTEEERWALIKTFHHKAKWVTVLNLLLQPLSSDEGSLRGEYWLIDPSTAYHRLRFISRRLTLREEILPDELIVYLYHTYLPTLNGPLGAHLKASDRGEIAVLRGDGDIALEALEKATPPQSGPRAAKHAVMTGAALIQCDQAGDAKPHFQRALTLNPGDLGASASLIHLAVAQGDLDGALEALKHLLNSNVGSPVSRHWLLREVHDALVRGKRLKEAKDLEPFSTSDACSHQLRALRLFFSGHREKALDALNLAEEQDPYDRRINLLRAKVYLKRRNYAESLRDIMAVLDFEPHHEGARGCALMALKHHKEIDFSAHPTLVQRLRTHPVLGAVMAKINGQRL